MIYVVTPTDEHRLALWERVYGRTHLPIKYPHPQIACTQRWGEVPVFYLDTTAVPAALLDRLATYEARRMGISYAEARLAVRREWLIRADGCRVTTAVATAVTTTDSTTLEPLQPAFPFVQNVPLRTAPRRPTHARLN